MEFILTTTVNTGTYGSESTVYLIIGTFQWFQENPKYRASDITLCDKSGKNGTTIDIGSGPTIGQDRQDGERVDSEEDGGEDRHDGEHVDSEEAGGEDKDDGRFASSEDDDGEEPRSWREVKLREALAGGSREEESPHLYLDICEAFFLSYALGEH
jgi:hypothetical protein